MHIILGSAPEKYHWLLDLFGFEGSIDLGIQELREFGIEYPRHAIESDVILAFIYSYLLQDNETGLDILSKHQVQNPSHLLLAYANSSLHIKNSSGEEALNVIQSYNSSASSEFPFFNYQLGNIYQQKGEYQKSTSSFEAFLKRFSGHNYIKDTYFKIGLNYLMENDSLNQEKYFGMARDRGQKLTEADKNAINMLNSAMPNKRILQLRLATDGGYYQRAEELAGYIASQGLANHKDSVEFVYRQARLWHKSGSPDKAIPYYESTIEISVDKQSYYAPNSALQLGYIYRDQNSSEKATRYFELALSYKNHPYKNSIDNKAKAALSAMKKQEN
jgi:TolA-binding protein